MKKLKSIRFPQTYKIRPLLGLNAGKLPNNTELMTWELYGLKFGLVPRVKGCSKRRRHRLYMECPVCHREFSAGRFNQHQGIHGRDRLSEFSEKYLRGEL